MSLVLSLDNTPATMKIKFRIKPKEPINLKYVIKKKQLKMRSAPYCIPKGNKLKPLGEDAHFISSDEQTIGVADGVGGWAKKGIDAGNYARELMLNSSIAVNKERSSVDPKRVLAEAFSNTMHEGSSTACVLTHDDGVLRAANVGDSGFMVLREGKLLFKSPTQQHRFNFPFQLGNNKKSDRPECALEIQVPVKPGDIVVMGSDGLFDNMFDSDIEEIIQEEYHKLVEENNKIDKYQDLAFRIAETAYYKSLDKYYVSPFAIASKLAGKKHKGGKMDDISIIVGRIVHEPGWKMSPLSS